MEFVQKKVEIITTTAITSGCTGNCYIIIPYSGTGVTYNFNINLTANSTDWGFFTPIEEGQDAIDGSITCNELSGVTSGTSECQSGYTFATGVTISNNTYLVSGSSSSRLSEVRKFSTDGTLEDLYFISTDPATDGVDSGLTTTGLTASTYVYYIGGITYTDEEVTGETTTDFIFESSGYSSPVFTNLPYIKNEDIGNVIEKPIVGSDVFIERGKASAFEDNYRLKNIRNLTEVTYYSGGAYFNIIENI